MTELHGLLTSRKGCKIFQTNTTETFYHSIKLHLKHVFQWANGHKLEIKLSQKPWRQEITNSPDWQRRKLIEKFRLCVGYDCLCTQLHCIGTRRNSFCTLFKLHDPTDRNHLVYGALASGTECERCWVARTKIMETDCTPSLLLLLLLLWLLIIFWIPKYRMILLVA
jgi:hypothetical protein